MSVNRIIQVAGSNTLGRAETPEQLRNEIRNLTLKLNDALRQLSQLVYTSEASGGTATTTVVVSADAPATPTPTATDEPFKKHFMLSGE
jgi:hypothetical protein